MRRPTIPRRRFLSIRRIVCIALSLAIIFIVPAPGRTQKRDRFALKIDRNKPVEAPKKKTTSAGSQTNKLDNTRSGSQNANSGPLSGCGNVDILVFDTILTTYIIVFNFPPNSAVPVTITQTNAGIVGYALTTAGPYTPTLNLVVNTDSNGYGESVDFYIQGQLVGQTTFYAEGPFGASNSYDFNVLPQCNCPAIPIVP